MTASLTEKTLEHLYEREKTFVHTQESLKGSPIDQLLEELPIRLLRCRVLTLLPGGTYYFHKDPSPRLHFVVSSNPNATFQIEEDCYNMTVSNRFYFADTRREHIAYNKGTTPRTHFVGVVQNEDIETLMTAASKISEFYPCLRTGFWPSKPKIGSSNLSRGANE